MAAPAESSGITGLGVGHVTDPTARTGCTVVVLPEGTIASCEVRGGAPATRELDALSPDRSVLTVDAVVLTGGSAFGLASADGVMRCLEERGRGVPTPAGRVPIVPALALFDLAAGDPSVRPTAEDGYAATTAAFETGPRVETGRVGAGTGAHVSQWRGAERLPGGLFHAEARHGDLVVGAICAVNAFGDVLGAPDGTRVDTVAALQGPFDFEGARSHTTIGLVVTNARLPKLGCYVVAQGAHDGLARAITPPHTRYDGDAFVAAATGEVEAHVDLVRLLAVEAVQCAIGQAAVGGAGPV